MTRSSRLHVLHTNDIHSHFDRMPRIAAALRELEREAGREPVIRLDIGDHMDRMRSETEGSMGLANIAVMNETRYDAAVLGNNEGLTFTPRMLDEAYGKHGRFPVLGSNLRLTGNTPSPGWLRRSLLLLRGGIRVGLIGVTADFADFYRELGWETDNPFDTALSLAEELRVKADAVIVMSHLGLRHDERLATLAKPGLIDAIIGGHTHHLLESAHWVNGTPLFAAGKYGQYVGHIAIAFDADGKVTGAEGGCVSTDCYEPDGRIGALIDSYWDSAIEALSDTAAVLERPLSGCAEEERSELGCLLAAALRSWTGADIGLINAGQLLDGLAAGRVTRERLLQICPSPINPCRIRLAGTELLQALEESLLDEYRRMPIRGFGFRGERLGALCIDGMTVRYEPDGEPLRKIRSVHIGDMPLIPEHIYEIGTIDMFTFGIGYRSLANGTVVKFHLPEFIRDLLADTLKGQAGALAASLDKSRWTTL